MSGVPTRPRTEPAAASYPGVMANGSACEFQPGSGESKAAWWRSATYR